MLMTVGQHANRTLNETNLPNHILITLHHQFQPFPVFGICDLGKETVPGNPARAAREDINIVDSKIEGLTMFIFLLDQFGSSEASSLGLCVQQIVLPE